MELKHHGQKSNFRIFACRKWAWPGVGLGVVLEFWDRKWTGCFPAVCVRLTTFQVDGFGASWSGMDFCDFCLCRDFAGQGVARSCGGATDFRARVFLGCCWARGSAFKRGLLIVGERKFLLNHPRLYIYVYRIYIIYVCILCIYVCILYI